MSETIKMLALSGGKDSLACLHLLKEELAGAIYVDTGYAYPETKVMIDYAETLVPVHRVLVDRETNHRQDGLPADVVPVEWTTIGQMMTRPKPYRIQSSIQCCFSNIAKPLFEKAKELGVTHLVYGQRHDESHRSTSKDRDIIEGIVRLQPIEHWTREEVLAYLSTKMTIPAHFHFEQSSLDCYDCTAYHAHSQDRIAWMKDRYPDYYTTYAKKSHAIMAALEASL